MEDKLFKKGEVYVVGGPVRNIVYNNLFKTKIPIKDIDLLIRGIEFNELKNLLCKYGTIREVGKKFGIIKFTKEGVTYDVALPRKDVSTGPGYKDFVITVDHMLDLKSDLERRDATINSLCIRINSFEDLNKLTELPIIDLVNGIDDIKNKLWRSVGDPNIRFYEDPTRMMRALRQCSNLNLELEKETRLSILKNYKSLDIIKKESIVRLTEELVRMLTTVNYTQWKFFFESKINEIYEIMESKYLLKCTDVNSNLNIRIACLLMSYDTPSVWTKKFELTAAPSFDKYNIKFVNNIKCAPAVDNLSVKELIQRMYKVDNTNYLAHSYDLLRLYDIINDSKITSLFYQNKNVIPSENHLKISGEFIIKKWNIKPIQVGKIKLRLFEEVTKGNIINELDELTKFIESNLFNESALITH
jgi:hypothetical protein